MVIMCRVCSARIRNISPWLDGCGGLATSLACCCEGFDSHQTVSIQCLFSVFCIQGRANQEPVFCAAAVHCMGFGLP